MGHQLIFFNQAFRCNDVVHRLKIVQLAQVGAGIFAGPDRPLPRRRIFYRGACRSMALPVLRVAVNLSPSNNEMVAASWLAYVC